MRSGWRDTETRGQAAGAVARGANPTIEATTDRAPALDGADYAINMIQVGGYRALDRDRLRDPEEIRPAPDHRRHPGHRRHHAGLRTIPVMLDICARHGGSLPGRVFLNYINPMAMLCWAMNRATRDQDGRPLPQRAGHRGRARRTTSACRSRDQLPLRRHQPHGLLPALRARRRGPLPALRQVAAEGREPAWNRVRYEMLTPLRLFRHRVERALRGVRALVHQARRPDLIERSTSRSTNTQPLRGSDRRLGRFHAP